MKLRPYELTLSDQIHISYSELVIIQKINHPAPKLIKKMSITHCHLESLKGIEQFISLQILNLKFNNLSAAEEILRIPSKGNLRQLNLQGNTIQYYSMCTYASLRSLGFENLVLLNNKDYSKWGKNRRKAPYMKKITQKLQKFQKSMSKTLKRVVRDNVIQKYRFAAEIQPIEQDCVTTSRHSQKQQTISSYKMKQNSQQKTPLRQISLSNVNMIRSAKGDHELFQRGNKISHQLIIEPIQFLENNQVSHMPLTQPTATFASQRQKQSMPFKSRNNCKSLINLVLEDDQQMDENEDDYAEHSFIINNCEYYSKARPNANTSNLTAFDEITEKTKENMWTMAQAYHLIATYGKVFKALRPSNMPRRVSYV